MELKQKGDCIMRPQNTKVIKNWDSQYNSYERGYMRSIMKPRLSSQLSKPGQITTPAKPFYKDVNNYIGNSSLMKTETRIAKSQPDIKPENLPRRLRRNSGKKTNIKKNLDVQLKKASSLTNFDRITGTKRNKNERRNINKKNIKELIQSKSRKNKSTPSKKYVRKTLSVPNTSAYCVHNKNDISNTDKKSQKHVLRGNNQKRTLKSTEANYDAVFFKNICVMGNRLTLWKKIKHHLNSSSITKYTSYETVNSKFKSSSRRTQDSKPRRHLSYFCYPFSCEQYMPSGNNKWNITKIRHENKSRDCTIPTPNTIQKDLPSYTHNLLSCSRGGISYKVMPCGDIKTDDYASNLEFETNIAGPINIKDTTNVCNINDRTGGIGVHKENTDNYSEKIQGNNRSTKLLSNKVENILFPHSQPLPKDDYDKTCIVENKRNEDKTTNVFCQKDKLCEYSPNSILKKMFFWYEKAWPPSTYKCSEVHEKRNNKENNDHIKICHKRSIRTQVTVKTDTKFNSEHPMNSDRAACCKLCHGKLDNCTLSRCPKSTGHIAWRSDIKDNEELRNIKSSQEVERNSCNNRAQINYKNHAYEVKPSKTATSHKKLNSYRKSLHHTPLLICKCKSHSDKQKKESSVCKNDASQTSKSIICNKCNNKISSSGDSSDIFKTKKDDECYKHNHKKRSSKSVCWPRKVGGPCKPKHGTIQRIRCQCRRIVVNVKGFKVSFRRKKCKKCEAAKSKKTKYERVYDCDEIYMQSLRRRPYSFVYALCPWCYPQCLGCVALARSAAHVCLFTLAACVWCPCLIALQLCRLLFCCLFASEC